MNTSHLAKPAPKRQLDLTQPKDLELFLNSAKIIYKDAMGREADAKADQYSRLQVEEFLGKEIFEIIYTKLIRLQKLIDHCRLDLIPDDREIPDEQVMEMQDLYNDMVLLCDYVWEKYPATDNTPRSGEGNDYSEVEPGFEPTSFAVSDTDSTSTRQAFAQAEKADPVSRVNADVIPNIKKSRPEDDETVLTKFLTEPRHQFFIKKHYETVDNFEHMLDSNVASVEDGMIDRLDRWLGDKPASAFHFLRDKLVADILEFDTRRDVRKILEGKRIKYEAYIFWVDIIPIMDQYLEPSRPMTFGEMYARFMIETEIDYQMNEEADSNSQLSN